jgi:hypothetical protein
MAELIGVSECSAHGLFSEMDLDKIVDCTSFVTGHAHKVIALSWPIEIFG